MSALVLQLGLFTDVRVLGVAPDLMLLVGVAAGLTGGANHGAVVGFVAGLLIDLWIPTPLGMSALAYSLTGFGIGMLVDSGVRAEGVLAVGYCALGSAAGVALFAVVGGLTGQPNVWTDDVARIILVSSLFNTVLAPLALVALRWADAHGDARPGAGVRMVN